MTLALTGKDKAARVPLEYFHRVGRTKWIITGTLILLALGGVGAALASGWWTRAASPGPVHFVHARWENNCEVCHNSITDGTGNPVQMVFGVGTLSDAKCQNCHSGPPHHREALPEGAEGSCASCHVEHRGRNSNLARSGDPTCTRCHANMKAVTKEGYKCIFAEKITRFDIDHPQFKLGPDDNRKPLGEAKDPGKLKFNHAAHLRPGQRLSLDDENGKKIGDLVGFEPDGKTPLKERYRKANPEGKRGDKDLVELTCASCHQLDSADAPPAVPGQAATPRSSGDYFLPVNFEQHCRACHPLQFTSSKVKEPLEIPHRLQIDEVRLYLSGALIDRELKDVRDSLNTGRPLPGKSLEEMRKAAKEDVKEFMTKNFEKESTEATRRSQLTTCGLCHYFGEKADAKGDRITFVEPTAVPDVWFRHAKFSHQAHRAVQCADCHPGANPTKEGSSKASDVLIPGINNCLQCHGPATTVDGKPQGGVRFECTTCHTYHSSDKPLSGRGSDKRGITVRKGTEDVLSGKSEK
jgi:predicted CXXCH cytochrome family protein